MRRITAILLTLAMLFCLTSLALRSSRADGTLNAASSPNSSPDDMLTEAYTKLYGLDSMHLEMNMPIQMSIRLSMNGQSMSIPMNITLLYQMDQQNAPLRTCGNISMMIEFMGNTQTNAYTFYSEQVDNVVTIYASEDGTSWTASRVESTPVGPSDMVSILMENTTDLRLVGTSTTEQGQTVNVCTGKLNAQYLQQVMEAAGSSEALSSMLGEGENAIDLSNLEEYDITVYIDRETKLPLMITMDMTSMMKDVMSQTIQSLMGTEGMEGMEVDVEISTAMTNCFLSQFNSVSPIEIPEAALAASAVSSSTQG